MAKSSKADMFKKTQETPAKSFNDIMAEYSYLANTLELGELTPELEERFIANQEDFEDKLAGIYYIISKLSSSSEGFLKDSMEFLSNRIKKNEHQIKFLKDRAMLIVELYGIEGKMVTDKINCSVVSKPKLDVNEDFELRLEKLKEAIKFNSITDEATDDELSYINGSISITNLDMETMAKVYEVINSEQSVIEREPNITLNLSINKPIILSALIDRKEDNDNRKVYVTEMNKLAKEASEKDGVEYKPITFEPVNIEIPGLSIGESRFPRFS